MKSYCYGITKYCADDHDLKILKILFETAKTAERHISSTYFAKYICNEVRNPHINQGCYGKLGNTRKYRPVQYSPSGKYREILGNTHFRLQYMYKMMGKIPKHTSETFIYLD